MKTQGTTFSLTLFGEDQRGRCVKKAAAEGERRLVAATADRTEPPRTSSRFVDGVSSKI